VALAGRRDERLVRLRNLTPLSRGERAVEPLDLVDVDPSVVERDEDVDASVAPAWTTACRPIVPATEEDGDDRLDVLTRMHRSDSMERC
jgi:hypothetical protein